MLKKSPFLHILSVDDQYCALYNSLNLEAAFVKKEFLEKCEREGVFAPFNKESKRILETLKDMGLLIDESSSGLDEYEDYKKALDKPAINILYLLLTDACNLRCGYCYVLANMESGYVFSMMKEDVAIRALDAFERHIKGSIVAGYKDQQIVIYGGEPTLNKKTLVTALNYIADKKKRGELPRSLSVTINTNGTRLDEEILRGAKLCDAVVAISVDGPPEVHNPARPYDGGKTSFKDVLKGYDLAKKEEVKTGLCCTVGEHNLDILQDIVTWFSEELGVKAMGFNILIENKCQEPIESGDYNERVAKKLIECFLVAREKGIYEDRVMRRVKNFIEKTPVFSDCGGCGLQMVVTPEGMIGVCQAFCGSKEYFVSEPFETFKPEEHPYWKLWRSRSPFTIPGCTSCIAFGNCGGGCPYTAYKKHGTIWALDERFCAHAKATTEFLIKDLWKTQSKKSE